MPFSKSESAPPKKLLGTRLLEAGHITPELLSEALSVQARTGEKLGEVLVRMGAVDPSVLAGFLEEAPGAPEAPSKGLSYIYRAGAAESAPDYGVLQLKEDGPGGVDGAPAVQALNELLLRAIEAQASDIHIEPSERRVRVRFRVDGLLHEEAFLPPAHGLGVVARLKVLAGMDIAEKRLPQDGRVRVRTGEQEIDLRVSTMPTVHGEKAVLRLLPKTALAVWRVSDLGLSESNLEKLLGALSSPWGMILIAGPTGSGKTTTLYAALNELNRPQVNIVTVEDPVECVLEGVNQTQINPKAGVTFASALRSLLRQDPDVIMVGEIRDPETAAVAVRAAVTGHLVLSTVHTGDAASAVVRLLDMGVEPYLLASSLLLVLSQRLVRRVCPQCSGAAAGEPAGVRGKGRGCPHCRHTGYRGRLGVHEALIVTPALEQLIAQRPSAEAIREEAVRSGMVELWQDGLSKAGQGLTTEEELWRVLRGT